MIPNLTQEQMTRYAASAGTIQEPTGTDYSQGVRVGRTVPAKWWNWLFSAVTKRIVQSRSDSESVLTELNNVITDTGLTPSASDNTQFRTAVQRKTLSHIDARVTEKQELLERWNVPQLSGVFPLNEIPFIAPNATWQLKNITQQNGLYFATNTEVVSQSSTSISVSKFAVVVSEDLEHWKQLDIPVLKEITRLPYTFNSGVVYFKGIYFINIYAKVPTNTQNAYEYCYVVCSADLESWTVVEKITRTSLAGSISIGTVGDMLLMTATGSDKITADGVNWTPVTGMSDTFHIDDLILRSVSVGNRYIVGECFMTTDRINYTALPDALLRDYIMGRKAAKLRNGNVLYPRYTTPQSTASTGYNIVAPDGTVTPVNNGYVLLDTTGGAYSHSIYHDPNGYYVLQNLSNNVVALTLDGIQVFNTPVYATNMAGSKAVVYLDGKYYICAVESVSGVDKMVLYSANAADVSNWTRIETPIEGSILTKFGAIPQLHALVVGSHFSLDYGVTWEDAYLYNAPAATTGSISAFCGLVFAQINNKFFTTALTQYRVGGGSVTVQVSFIACATNFINRVVEHTLYVP